MLQQTQVATVIPYYERFLARFPDLRSLAAASEQEVLALWSGLGYYGRARNILRAARELAAGDGVFPRDFEKILALPGIGRYTAGAICSIAYNEPRPAVDGNIRRFIARLEGKRWPAPESFFYRWMKAWTPSGRASSFLQAMMDFGATVCLPNKPDCPRCAAADFCKAKSLGIQDRVPPPRRKRPPRHYRLAILIIERKGRILLRALDGDCFIPGRWGLPFEIQAGPAKPEDYAARLCLRILGRRATPEFQGRVRHSIADRILAADVFKCDWGTDSFRLPDNRRFRWAPLRCLDAALTSSLFRKALRTAGLARPYAQA
jgi:A/G-specific adenine glycosylase